MEFAGTMIRMLDADPVLIVEYHMRPVVVVLVLGPACQHAAVAAIIRNQYEMSVSNAIQLLLNIFGSCNNDTAPSPSYQVHLILDTEESLFRLLIGGRAGSSFE